MVRPQWSYVARQRLVAQRQIEHWGLRPTSRARDLKQRDATPRRSYIKTWTDLIDAEEGRSAQLSCARRIMGRLHDEAGGAISTPPRGSSACTYVRFFEIAESELPRSAFCMARARRPLRLLAAARHHVCSSSGSADDLLHIEVWFKRSASGR